MNQAEPFKGCKGSLSLCEIEKGDMEKEFQDLPALPAGRLLAYSMYPLPMK